MADRIALKSLTRRYLELYDEAANLDIMIKAYSMNMAPELVSKTAVGYESAAELMISTRDNPNRLVSEASFAALCDVNPIPASPVKTQRHRLKRVGDRAANNALHIISTRRLRLDDT